MESLMVRPDERKKNLSSHLHVRKVRTVETYESKAENDSEWIKKTLSFTGVARSAASRWYSKQPLHPAMGSSGRLRWMLHIRFLFEFQISCVSYRVHQTFSLECLLPNEKLFRRFLRPTHWIASKTVSKSCRNQPTCLLHHSVPSQGQGAVWRSGMPTGSPHYFRSGTLLDLSRVEASEIHGHLKEPVVLCNVRGKTYRCKQTSLIHTMCFWTMGFTVLYT